jgi:Nucleotidyltransferase of unknown function (DUF6036)
VSDSTAPQFDRATIRDLLRQLGERLVNRGVTGELYIIGGAAMALAYDARRSTRDIDAVWLPHGIVQEEAGYLAAELGLPRWWLNEQASVYIAAGGDPTAPVSFDHPGLRVLTASPEHLLSMKVLAARRRDVDDLRVLVGVLGLTSVAEVVAVCARVFPDEPLPGRSMLVLADLFEDLGGDLPLG